MIKFRHLHLVCVAVAVVLANRPVDAEPLNVAPGSDPGGIAVAVILPPFPLGSAVVREKLARDGEGVAIGWDFSKRPKSSEAGVSNTEYQPAPQIVTALTGRSNIRLVPAFVDRLRPSTWAQAIAFIARTPARIVVIPFATDTESDWVAFRAAAEYFPNLLFVVPAQISDRKPGDEAKTDDALGYPAKFHLPNVLSVSASAIPEADLVLVMPSNTATSEVALAVTVKALLFCTSAGGLPASAMSKLEALAKLGALNTPQANNPPNRGPRSVTPCTEALD